MILRKQGQRNGDKHGQQEGQAYETGYPLGVLLKEGHAHIALWVTGLANTLRARGLGQQSAMGAGQGGAQK